MVCFITDHTFHICVLPNQIVYRLKIPGSKKWCAHLTRHVNDTKIRRQPSHTLDHHPISTLLARNIQTYYSRSIGMKKMFLKEDDRLYKTCYHRERARFDKY